MSFVMGFFNGFNAGRRYLSPKDERSVYKKGYKVGLWWNGLTRKERKLMRLVMILGLSSIGLSCLASYLLIAG